MQNELSNHIFSTLDHLCPSQDTEVAEILLLLISHTAEPTVGGGGGTKEVLEDLWLLNDGQRTQSGNANRKEVSLHLLSLVLLVNSC